MDENKKTVKIDEETWVVYNPNEVVNELSEVESNEEPEEEKKSNVSNMLLARAVFATSMAVTHASIKIFEKVKTKRIDKELRRIKEDIIKQYTEDGKIDEYSDYDIEEIAKYVYKLKKDYNLK